MSLRLVFALCIFPVFVFAQKGTPEDEKAVYEADYAWRQAYLKADAEALAAIELEGFTLNDADGISVTRQNDIERIKTGTLRFQSLSAHELSLRIYGDAAVLSGRAVLKATSGDRPEEGIFQFTDVFARHEGRWRAIAAQWTRVAPTANSSIEPLPRDSAWLKRHEEFVAIAQKGNVDVLFLGDSITDFWRRPEQGLPIWEKNFAPLRAANFGISGDRTQHVLWRLRNGELQGIQPRAVVLMIGTNNAGLERDKLTPRNSNAEVIAGVTAVVNELRMRLPQAKILLLAIFPRGAAPNDPNRLQVQKINAALAKLHDGKDIHFMDIGPKFLQPDGTISTDVMPDFLHPGPRGYQIWADAIREPLARLLQ